MDDVPLFGGHQFAVQLSRHQSQLAVHTRRRHAERRQYPAPLAGSTQLECGRVRAIRTLADSFPAPDCAAGCDGKNPAHLYAAYERAGYAEEVEIFLTSRIPQS